jgi:protein gp37
VAIKTGIQFADSTVNGMAGCDGCELWMTRPDGTRVRICYAGRQTENMLSNGPRKGWPTSFDVPALFPGRIEATARWKDLTGTTRTDKPWLNGMPRVIFCDDMGDRWTASLPLDSLAPTLPSIARSPHIYLFLTKRPDRAAAFSRTVLLPENLWLGTTITSGQDARLRALERSRAARLWVSYEPILADAGDVVRRHREISWWVFGGSSGEEATPTDIGIIERGVAACREVGAAPFVKQIGARPFWREQAPPFGDHPIAFSLLPRDRKGGNPMEWREALRVREYPR